METKDILYVGLFLALLGIIVVLFLHVVYLQSKIEEFSRTMYNITNYIEGTMTNISQKIDILESKIQHLNSSINSLTENVSAIQYKLYGLENNIEELYNKYDEIKEAYKELVQYSDYIKEWLESSQKSRKLQQLIADTSYKCSRGEAFDIACFSYYLYDIYNIQYRFDNETYGKEDVLVSPETFLDVKKGDCEDFAFLYYTLVEKLKEKGYHYIIVPKRSESSQYVVWFDDSNIWYLQSTKPFYIDINQYNPFVFCFKNFLEDNTYEGHCMVTLCPFNTEKFINASDWDILENCYIIEPQEYGYLYELPEFALPEVVEVPGEFLPEFVWTLEGPSGKTLRMGEIYAKLNKKKICIYINQWVCLPFQK